MKKANLYYIALSSIMLIFVIALAIIRSNPKYNEVCFNDRCFFVELAITQQEKIDGLMFRESLDPDKGMLFVYEEEAEYSFWMKNVNFPLDIVWINGNREVIYIKRNFQPCMEDSCEIAKPSQKAKYALELNADVLDEMSVEIGDKLVFHIEYEHQR